MKRFLKILAVVGTGVVIGSVASIYLKAERRQIGKTLKDLVKENKLMSRSSVKENEDELELYFI